MGGGMLPGGGMGGMLGSKGGRANGGRGGGPLIIPKGGGGGLRRGGGPRSTGVWAGAGAGAGLRNRTACCTILTKQDNIKLLHVFNGSALTSIYKNLLYEHSDQYLHTNTLYTGSFHHILTIPAYVYNLLLLALPVFRPAEYIFVCIPCTALYVCVYCLYLVYFYL